MPFNQNLVGWQYKSMLADIELSEMLMRYLYIIKKYSEEYEKYCKETVDKISAFESEGLREFNEKIEEELSKLKARYPDKLEKVDLYTQGEDVVAGWRIKDNSLRYSFMIDIYENFWRTVCTNHLPPETSLLVWLHTFYNFTRKMSWEFWHYAEREKDISENLKKAIELAKTENQEAEAVVRYWKDAGFGKNPFGDEANEILKKNNEIIKDAHDAIPKVTKLSEQLFKLVDNMKNVMKEIEAVEPYFGVSFRQESESYQGKINDQLFKDHISVLKKTFEKLSAEFGEINKSIKIRKDIEADKGLLKKIVKDEEYILQEIISYQKKTKKIPKAA